MDWAPFLNDKRKQITLGYVHLIFKRALNDNKILDFFVLNTLFHYQVPIQLTVNIHLLQLYVPKYCKNTVPCFFRTPFPQRLSQCFT